MISRWMRRALVTTTAALMLGAVGTPALAALPGASGSLTRAPYLTDLTAGSVRITWATSTQTTGQVKYGPSGDCTANTVASPTLGTPVTVNGVTQYQHSVALLALQPGTTYCYRVYTGDPGSIDLLGSNPSPRFTTLSPGSTEPFSFVVFSDSGDTTNSTGGNDGSVNQNQASLHAQIAASGARFAIATGDIVHPSGTPTNYGDLNQTGPNVSALFGPQYWAVPGQSVPLYVASGNHAKNATFLSTFPQTSVAAASGGVNGLVNYPSYFGSNPGDFATTYYAFSMGGVRFYVLEAAWQDSNVGNADGGACGKYCEKYQLDHAAHWTVDSAQYQWLAADLAAHPGGLKFAFFHFPLRSDDKSQPSSVYLQNTPGSTGSLEELLYNHGVDLVFNGHSHTYQRFVAPPGGVPSYVLGGGGGRLVSVGNISGGCSPMNAYALGWSYSSGGSSCGAASKPTSPAQVHHFVKVTVDGSTVTVTPINALGQAFDVVSYNFGADTAPPSAPGNVAAAVSTGSGRVTLTWTGAADNVGVTAYDIYRGGDWLATTTATARSYVDKTAVAGASYLYEVRARDLAGNATGATAAVGDPDSIAPTVPTSVQALSTGPTSVTVSWAASSDNVGVTSYTVRRDGLAVATTDTTTYAESGLAPGSTHEYSVSAADAAGNSSAPSQPVTVTTDPDDTPPSVPSGLVVDGVSASSVSLSWGASTDDVGVVRYEVLRDGVVVGSSPLTSFVDTTVAAESTYSYVVRAVDVGGNTASSGALVVTTMPAWLVFGDGFESGGLGQWNTVAGLEVDSDVAHSGGFAVRQVSSGSATYAYKHLSGGYDELWISGWVYVASRSTSVNLFGFRASTGGSIVNVYVDSRGLLSVRNNAGGVTTYSTTVVPVGSWHRVVLHAVVNGSSSSLDVSFDGVVVPELTLTGQDLGTKPIGRVQLGETSTGRTYDVIIDDLQVSTVTPA